METTDFDDLADPVAAPPTTWRERLVGWLPQWLRSWLCLDLSERERQALDDDARIW